jgi:hypothetical protein
MKAEARSDSSRMPSTADVYPQPSSRIRRPENSGVTTYCQTIYDHHSALHLLSRHFNPQFPISYLLPYHDLALKNQDACPDQRNIQRPPDPQVREWGLHSPYHPDDR